MTSRELTEDIDALCRLRAHQALREEFPRTDEAAEIIKRRIADGLKELDHRPGVAAFGPNEP